MRFLHTADWHIGKRLYNYGLEEEQEDAFRQILALAKQEKVDAIVLAGDIYDRALPNEQAVAMVNQMLQQVNLTAHFPLLAISGNHDSAIRLETGSPWFKATDFYLHTQLEQAFTPIELNDTQFFLLPYFEPFAARQYFKDDKLRTIAQAMPQVVAAMQAKFAPNKKHVLVAHFFAAGSQQSDSETKVTVGGLDAVPTDALAAFDYVALGHLHNETALHTARIKYSGSPLKFSVSEAQVQKGVWIVDTEPFHTEFLPLTPLRDVTEVTASFTELIDPNYYTKLDRNNFIAINLTDTKVIPNVMQELRQIYPYILSLTRENGREVTAVTAKKIRNLSPLTLLADFFKETTTQPLTAKQEKLAATALKIAEKDGD
ncbi:exonuclease SbcCD subunit D [Loigolactobacillus jiayinensis]|uniref:Nuclease SbcCD subunit D n=1 Tax=Loigolactobacillus jiayinensis TaxID=2486016 RepID=A0ABW1R9W9_9LACO|nr:exonuclease SbcCD subunit D [Loigolactobacillus jiayinensis]